MLWLGESHQMFHTYPIQPPCHRHCHHRNLHKSIIIIIMFLIIIIMIMIIIIINMAIIIKIMIIIITTIKIILIITLTKTSFDNCPASLSSSTSSWSAVTTVRATADSVVLQSTFSRRSAKYTWSHIINFNFNVNFNISINIYVNIDLFGLNHSDH